MYQLNTIDKRLKCLYNSTWYIGENKNEYHTLIYNHVEKFHWIVESECFNRASEK